MTLRLTCIPSLLLPSSIDTFVVRGSRWLFFFQLCFFPPSKKKKESPLLTFSLLPRSVEYRETKYRKKGYYSVTYHLCSVLLVRMVNLPFFLVVVFKGGPKQRSKTRERERKKKNLPMLQSLLFSFLSASGARWRLFFF